MQSSSAVNDLSRSLLSVHSAVEPGLRTLGDWLIDHHYGHQAAERILDFVEREGTVTGAPDLDPEDEARATDAYIDGLADVPPESPRWDDQGVIIDVELYRNGVHPTPFPEPPAELPELPEHDQADDDDDPTGEFPPVVVDPTDPPAERPDLAAFGLAAIAGGSPEADGPFEPSAADWSDYLAWSRELDERRSAAGRLDVARIEAVGRALYGNSPTAAY